MAPDVPDRYDPSAFPPFAVTVDVVLFTIRDEALEVLLIERGGEPCLGAWALPGGFVRPDEDLDQAAGRELAEETGLAQGAWHLEQLAAYGTQDRDPRMRVVTVAYWAICADLPAPRGGGDAVVAELVSVERIESGAVRLAFDHERIVMDALERTRSRLEYTALAARFCPPEFTIRELRRVYETIWGISLDPGNFQRYVRECGAFEKCAAPPSPRAEHGRRTRRGRPASLWTARCGDLGRPLAAVRASANPRRRARTNAPDSLANPANPGPDEYTVSPPSRDGETLRIPR